MRPISEKKRKIQQPGFIAYCIAVLIVSGCASENEKRLKKAMDSFQLEPGLRIELAASEPMVIDPVALAFDEDRNMYVVEDRGYPDSSNGGTPTTQGRIAFLKDTDGDGKYDDRSEFVTGLTYPNGVLPWRGGIFVTCAPDIYYFKDTTGDGVADIRKVALTGFSADKTAQIRVSTPILGLDGWIYISGGLNSGKITSPEHPERAAVAYASADGRFHPETLEFQVTGGVSQYGLSFDRYGRRFGCSNRHPIQQIVLEPRSLSRNPHLLFSQTIQNVSASEAEAKVFPISGAITSADFIPKLIGRSHTGTFTSACGLLVFNGSALTPEHRGNAFICEPAQNLIQRQIMHPKGVSFSSSLPYEEREFLSSTDEWFRPVFLQHGPEGALYIADMYRKVIDHPSYVPEEARALLDFESGKTDGRIYRIVREDFRRNNSASSLLSSKASPQQLLKALESPEEWERETAQRLLLQDKISSLIPDLKRCVAQSALPETRVRALWTLRSYGALDDKDIIQALADKESGVREQAALLAEELINQYPRLMDAVIVAAADTAARVRFNSALTLGSLNDPSAIEALAEVAARDGDDRWVRAAVLSGIGSRLPEFLRAFQMQKAPDPQAFAAVMQDLGRLFGNAASLAECRLLLKSTIPDNGALNADHSWKIYTILGLAEGLSGRAEMKAGQHNLLYELLGKNAAAEEKRSLNVFMENASRVAQDEKSVAGLRVVAANLLGYSDFEKAGNLLKNLLGARNPPEVQLAAVSSLARMGDARGGKLLMEKEAWSNYTPSVRSAVIAAMVSKPAFMQLLFSAIQDGVITAPEISAMDRERLINNKDTNISEQAKSLFKELEGGGRMQVYESYRDILAKPDDAVKGKAVFKRVCSVCHAHSGEGGKVGPDLTGINNQPADALLLHILVPNYEVLPAYQAISVQTKDGRTLTGWLVAETENSMTFRTSFGADESILRTNISSLTNSGLSLMPDGLEKSMTKEELANLIAFLKAGRE